MHSALLPRRVPGAGLQIPAFTDYCCRCLKFAVKRAERSGRTVDDEYADVRRESSCQH